MQRLSIKTKLSLGLSVILVLSFLAVSLINYYVAKGSIRRGVIEDALPVISNNIYSELQKDLITPINVSSLMAHDTFLKDWVMEGEKDLGKITRYLTEIRTRYGFFSAFFISEATKNYYYYDGILKKVDPNDEHDVWYWNFKKMGRPYDLDVDTNQAADGALTIFINHALNDHDGKFLGVTGVGLNMQQVGRMLESYQDRYGKSVYLVDGSGLVQVHPVKELIQTHNIHQEPGLAPHAEAVLTPSEEPVVREFERGDQNIILMGRFIPEFSWFLMVEQVEGALLAEIKASFWRSLAIGLGVTALVIAIIVLMVNYYQGRLEAMATTDELTGICNRRHFSELAQRELAQSRRGGPPVSLLMLDADHFKRINDAHGHLTGDQALRELVGAVQSQLREYDVVGRWGGEEFAVLLPGTMTYQAVNVAERIRQAVSELTLEVASDPRGITVSAGVANSEAGPDTSDPAQALQDLVNRADRALYEAKAEGRNRVKAEPQPKPGGDSDQAQA